MPQESPILVFAGVWAHVQGDEVYSSPFFSSSQPFYRKIIFGRLDLELGRATPDLVRGLCNVHPSMVFAADSCWHNDGVRAESATLMNGSLCWPCADLTRHNSRGIQPGETRVPPLHLLVPSHLELVVDGVTTTVFSLGQGLADMHVQGLTPIRRMELALRLAKGGAERYTEAVAV